MAGVDKGLMALVVAVLVMCGGGLVVTPSAAASESEEVPLVPAVYVFGDSTVDVGNNGPLPPPYGIDFPHPGPTGRVTNGYNVADSISRLLGFEMSPPAYRTLTPETSRQILRGFGGVSYASGFSGILDKTGNGTNCLSMAQQVEFFAATKLKMTEYAGSKGSVAIDTLLSESLFLISTGGNDMFEFLLKPEPFFYARLLSKYTKHLQTLYNLGARRFGIIDVPPMGCVPVIRAKSPTGETECVAAANLLAKRFNNLLRGRMVWLASLPKWSGMTYSVGSSYNLVINITANPEAAGFRNVTSACCGDGRLGAESWCLPNATICENRDDYLYWDMAHSSQATSIKGADLIFAAPVEQGFSKPINFQQLVSSTDGFDGSSSS